MIVSPDVDLWYLTIDMILGWLYYVDNDIDKAIELTLQAIDEEFMHLPEVYYNLSKFYAVKKDSRNSLEYLDEAINRFDNLSYKLSFV